MIFFYLTSQETPGQFQLRRPDKTVASTLVVHLASLSERQIIQSGKVYLAPKQLLGVLRSAIEQNAPNVLVRIIDAANLQDAFGQTVFLGQSKLAQRLEAKPAAIATFLEAIGDKQDIHACVLDSQQLSPSGEIIRSAVLSYIAHEFTQRRLAVQITRFTLGVTKDTLGLIRQLPVLGAAAGYPVSIESLSQYDAIWVDEIDSQMIEREDFCVSSHQMYAEAFGLRRYEFANIIAPDGASSLQQWLSAQLPGPVDELVFLDMTGLGEDICRVEEEITRKLGRCLYLGLGPAPASIASRYVDVSKYTDGEDPVGASICAIRCSTLVVTKTPLHVHVSDGLRKPCIALSASSDPSAAYSHYRFVFHATLNAPEESVSSLHGSLNDYRLLKEACITARAQPDTASRPAEATCARSRARKIALVMLLVLVAAASAALLR